MTPVGTWLQAFLKINKNVIIGIMLCVTAVNSSYLGEERADRSGLLACLFLEGKRDYS